MREIIFRGKRIDNGEWVEGLPFGSIYGGFSNGAICSIRKAAEKYGDVHSVVIETVGQFTGLYDKNSKRIFEGDIIEYQPEYAPVPTRSYVEYFADKYNYPAFDLAEHDYEANGLQCAHEEAGCEVIGNKWDNPELLEVKK